MVDLLGVGLGVFLTLVAVGIHYTRGATWQAPEDISQQVLERRAATVAETDFPEPGNRAIGGGGGAAAAIAGGAESELEEGGEAEAEQGPDAIPDDEAETFEIEFVKEGVTLDVAENETILDVGEEEGLDLPFQCREGQCISCSAHVDGGNSEEFVTHWHNQMLGEEELDEGYMLTCVAYPKADFSIETRESP